MNIVNSTEESTSKAQENGDASNGSERPLKKARFAWQVKGKHHLKNDSTDAGKTPTTNTSNPERAGSSGTNNSNGGTEQNLEILGDYLLNQEFIPLNSMITKPEESLLIPSASVSTEKFQYPRYVSSNVLKRINEGECHRKIETDAVPVSMIVTQNNIEDQCIAKWQARQMETGFVDNTINRVLDSWIQVQLPQEEDGSRFLVLDVADFINNLPGDNSIENEGILMAISAHGLQNTSTSSIASNSNIEEDSPEAIRSPSPQLSLSPIPSDEESHLPNNNPCDTDTETSSNNLDMAWSYSVQQNNDVNDLSFPLFPASSLSYDYENHQNTNNECEQDNQCDFLDAAVLFAIQSKGLTTFGTDYG